MKEMLKSKRIWIIFIMAIILLSLVTSNGTDSEKLEEQEKEITKLEKEVTQSNEKVSTFSEENKNLKVELQEKSEKLAEAEPWFEMSEEKRQREIEAEEAAAEKAEKEKAEKAAAEKAAKEAKKKAAEEAKEAKEKQGYNTGITYNQLARTPDDYIGEKVKFSGKVVQVMEDDDTVQIRLAVNNNYDTIILAEYDASIVNSRILEDDQITVMGISGGIITYESTLGGEISIPAIIIDKIE